MPYLFFVSLTTAVVSGYISQKSSDEISYLTTAIAFLSLIITLIFAPWQIQLLLVIAIIFIFRQLWVKNVPKEIEQTTNLSNETENRKYRGVTYTEKPASTTEVQKKLLGKYRGSPCQMVQSQPVSVTSVRAELKYRGASVSHPESQEDHQTESC